MIRVVLVVIILVNLILVFGGRLAALMGGVFRAVSERTNGI